MKIEIYMLLPFIAGVYSFYMYLKIRKSKHIVHKIYTPIFIMLSILGIFLFIFFIFYD